MEGNNMYDENQLLLAIGNMLDTKLEPIKSEIASIKNKVSNIEERTLSIELTLENEIPKRFDSLYDGYKLNREFIEKVGTMAEETSALVLALDIAKFVNSGNGKNLKIVK